MSAPCGHRRLWIHDPVLGYRYAILHAERMELRSSSLSGLVRPTDKRLLFAEEPRQCALTQRAQRARAELFSRLLHGAVPEGGGVSKPEKAAREDAGASKAGRTTGGAPDPGGANGADPSAAPSLERFEAVRGQTECVFARGTRLWGAETWAPGAFARNLDRFATLLTRFAAVADAQRLDGIVLEVAEPGSGATVERLATTTRAVVEGLTARDPAPAPGPPVDEPRWWLTFSGSALFVATFAPCYDATSSRYGFGLEHTYLLFQTCGSFVRRHAPGSGVLPESARVRTRAAFAASGRPYDLALTLSPLEAHRFVKPSRLGEPPIEWWKAPRGPDEWRERSDDR